MTLDFIAKSVLGGGYSVVCHLYSGWDGGNLHEVRCGMLEAEPARTRVIHVYNPSGVHFDPLWPELPEVEDWP